MLAVTGGGPGNTAGSGTAANPRPVSTAVKAINNQLKESAERFNQNVKKLSGADKTADTNTAAN